MWRTEDTDEGQDLVYDGMEAGIAPSPHKGTANIQNANISTEQGEVLASFGRTSLPTQSAITNGTLTPSGATNFTGPSNLLAGQWISVTASTVTSIDILNTPSTVSIDYIIVGGGGGGGGFNAYAGGGGGAGEFITNTDTFSVGSYNIVVGDGGIGGGPGAQGSDGTSSSFNGETAIGGGGGGDGNNTLNGRTGASGGGAGASNITAGTGGVGTAGNNGGAGDTATADETGGGGGGSGAVGDAGTGAGGGDGGSGTSSTITGTSVFYAAGGGGGGSNAPAGEGGSSVGGAGGSSINGGTGEGSSAVANSGSGGGGGGGTGVGSGGDGADGVVILSYTSGTMIASGGEMHTAGNKTIHIFKTSGLFVIDTILPNQGLYFVSSKSGTTFTLSSIFDPYATATVTHGVTGSVTFDIVATPSKGIHKATEKYNTNTETRYYVLDQNSRIWVYDTLVYSTNGTGWMLTNPYATFDIVAFTILNGWLIVFGEVIIAGTPTVLLGKSMQVLIGGYMTNRSLLKTAISAAQGKAYYTDGNIIGEIFPTTSFLTTLANIQSFCSYTATTNVGTIDKQIAASLPYTQDANGLTARIPVVFFSDGTQPTNLTIGTVYWIEMAPGTLQFQVFAAKIGGAPIDIDSGAAGNQYFNTFYPVSADAGANGTNSTVQLTIQRVNLPAWETAKSLVEVGNVVLIGGDSNLVYPWNQVDALPSDFITLPENDVKTMINVNNMAYIFAGKKGNIYITNGSVASLALKVPDYVAGVPGTPSSYIEPYFEWFDAAYIRGRVYFSILDQTATKAGNCGGVWSFIPTGNMASTDAGLALRLESQNSYGTYNGAANLIIPLTEQNFNAPQYFTWWQSSITAPTYGIDQTATVPVTSFVIETDLIPTGTLLSQDTFTQLEYKLSTNALSGDTVQLYYRLNSTDAWASCGTARIETNAPLSGYYDMAFQKTQWLQFRAVCSTPGTTTSSFTRLAQIRLR